ncbi:hypothetical protein H4R33_001875 [Dimargaris cristalligena]|nr:hypothetical protein H4R33_001875 [Dimargaris cristalligena]
MYFTSAFFLVILSAGVPFVPQSHASPIETHTESVYCDRIINAEAAASFPSSFKLAMPRMSSSHLTTQEKAFKLINKTLAEAYAYPNKLLPQSKHLSIEPKSGDDSYSKYAQFALAKRLDDFWPIFFDSDQSWSASAQGM